MTHKHLYERATGKIGAGGYFDPIDYNTSTHGVFELPDSVPFPDALRQRWDGANGALRAATQAELDADTAAALDATATAGSRDKVVLATCATVLEKFDPTWTGLTAAQKRAAVLALADRWKFWRQYVENNV